MKDDIFQPHKSSISDIDANIMAMAVYLVGFLAMIIPGINMLTWLLPLIVLLIEKNSRLVRFHAAQSLVLTVFSAVIAIISLVMMAGATVGMALSPIPFLGGLGLIGILMSAMSLAILVFTVLAAVGAYGYKEYHIPFIILPRTLVA